jgi:hypothetical protein
MLDLLHDLNTFFIDRIISCKDPTEEVLMSRLNHRVGQVRKRLVREGFPAPLDVPIGISALDKNMHMNGHRVTYKVELHNPTETESVHRGNEFQVRHFETVHSSADVDKIIEKLSALYKTQVLETELRVVRTVMPSRQAWGEPSQKHSWVGLQEWRDRSMP